MKPIVVSTDNRKANAKEITALRGLIGSLQWPAGQACPQLSCSISMLAGLVPSANTETLKVANKTLRFAKKSCNNALKFPTSIGVNYGLLALSDAAWGVREDGSSQGGYMILAVPPRMFED